MTQKTIALLFFSALSLWLPAQNTQIDPQKVTIVRDQWGMPHVYAQTNNEMAYGIAWAQCEDNFEVLQQTVLFSKGMLGRTFGKKLAPGDFFSGFTGLDQRIDSLIHTDVSPDFMRYLEAFCQGINDYARLHPEEILQKKAFPVTPQDILKSYPLKIAEFTGLGRLLGALLNDTRTNEQAEADAVLSKGSNAFAFRREMTKDDRTYLIANPHIGLTGPEAFYEMHVESEEGMSFQGGMFPGSVSLQIGTNHNLGWTHTNNYYDHTDAYLLKMHPSKPLYYEFDGQWLKLEEKTIPIAVKLKALPFPVRVKKKIYNSVYGPTVQSKGGNFFAVRNPMILNVKAPEQWFRMALAQNMEEFKKALEWNGLPYFNITYADKEDNILYIFNGLFPERTPGYNWQEIVPGNSTATLWQNYVPLEKRPQIQNPDCGFVYNVNHSPFKCTCEAEWLNPENYDPLVSYNTIIDDLPRSLRFREIYQDGTRLSMEELKTIKYDAGLAKDHPIGKTARFLQTYQHPDYQDLLDLMKNWDLSADPNSPAPTIYYLILSTLPRDYIPENETLSDQQLNKGLAFAKEHLMKYFGRLDVPFRDFARLKRGNKEVHVYGYRNTLAARGGYLDKDNGKYYITNGDSFMMFIQYDKDGVAEMESIVPFGNSNRPGSPHYSDQMELFVNKQAKKLTFDREAIFNNAQKIYHPQER
ncbi:MAG: penicillin acylase family protein [Saprospiraceae bacterium]|nr:penicillin acylase family protein [Saprospiraceae bacterium]